MKHKRNENSIKKEKELKMKKNYLFALLCVCAITLSGCAGNRTTPCCDSLKKEQPVVHFAFDSAHLTSDAKHSLKALSEKLKNCPKLSVKIVGYTDDTGTEQYNMKLGQMRANAVQSYLMGLGIKSNHIHTKSMGEKHPITSNSTQEGRQQNRRAVIHFK